VLGEMIEAGRGRGLKGAGGGDRGGAGEGSGSSSVCNHVCVPMVRELEEPSQATTVQSCGHRSHCGRLAGGRNRGGGVFSFIDELNR